MSIVTTLWEHIDFGGVSVTSNSFGSRYCWTKYGAHNDLFSSMRAWSTGDRGNIYAFEDIDFDGRFASLNVGGNSSAWWSYFGDDFNDVVSSSLIIRRDPIQKETEVALRSPIVSQFTTIFDRKTADKPISRSGEPRIYATYFPPSDPREAFVTIEQEMTVDVPIPIRFAIWNPFGDDLPIGPKNLRHEAWVRYYIHFFVRDGVLFGEATRCWVRVRGLIPGVVLGQLLPQMSEAMSDITAAIQSALGLFARGRYTEAYLLPGAPPDMNQAGQMGRYDDDVTLVVVAA
jgi:hypothetical protein